MDSDNDNKISAQEIDIRNISTEVLESFAPLLCEMEEENFVLDKKTFVQAACCLLNVIANI